MCGRCYTRKVTKRFSFTEKTLLRSGFRALSCWLSAKTTAQSSQRIAVTILDERRRNIPQLDTRAAPAPSTQQSFLAGLRVDGSRTAAESDISKAIADWLTSIEAASPGTVDAANDPSWVLAHMPPVELLPFVHPSST